MLEVKNVDAGYDFLQVIWDVTLHVADGEFVALIGPNGAGKTTTLRTIAGLLTPPRGQVRFQDRPINGLPAHRISRMGISFVSETLNLFPAMSVYENLLLGAYTVHNKAAIQTNLSFVFDLFPRLHERRNQLAGTLSGGERKMLAIARGMMSSPALMLVDEPSLGLAPKLTLAVFAALQALRQRGVTILLVEQNVNTTLHMADRAYVIEQGRIVLEGQGTDLLNNVHVQKAYLGI
ncbi:MAG TPA: ABC transporter ATP-binding protein [Anaerolineales bacterium]|nr:ABC transporter ATP-binding protein [Anaerolineales bacterium]HLB46651.1 ABC transporter ATP-binding protein [Anaerolineales bacterium]